MNEQDSLSFDIDFDNKSYQAKRRRQLHLLEKAIVSGVVPDIALLIQDESSHLNQEDIDLVQIYVKNKDDTEHTLSSSFPDLTNVDISLIRTLFLASSLRDELVFSNKIIEEYGVETCLVSKITKSSFKQFLQYRSKNIFGIDKLCEQDGRLIVSSYYQQNKISVPTRFLDYFSDFITYCAFLKLQQYPFNERFIIHGKHWLCGEVRTNDAGEISIFLFDSLPTYLTSRLNEIKAVLKNRTVMVYIPNVAMQRDTQNCAVFAIDGWRKLEKVGYYLPTQYHGNLFEYLVEHATLSEVQGGVQIYTCQLPLYLLKLMQSRILLSSVIPNRAVEKELPCNHWQEKPDVACLKSFRRNSDGSILINDRVLHKRVKFKTMVAENLKSHSSIGAVTRSIRSL